MRFVFSVTLFFLSISFVFSQIYVAPNGTGDGSSWANATNIENAIASAPNDAELRLREGTYGVTTTLSVTRRLTIHGGYTGVGANRNIAANSSVLNGGGVTHIMVIAGGGTVVDGVIFSNGFAATGVDVNDGSGGGALRVDANNILISNCVFRNNRSVHRIGSGAIYLWSCDNIRIEDCLFENNRVEENVSPTGSNIGGGAIHIRFGRNTEIVNTVFRNNYSRYSGGAIQDWGDDTLFENCVFEHNESGENGGGIYLRDDYTLINNCRFIDNQAVDGGGIATNSGKIEIRASYFERNRSQDRGGAIYNHRFADPSIIERVTFSENSAVLGGAIYNYSEEGLQVVSSLFADNQATDMGSAVFNNRFIEITNATFVRNTNTALVMSRLTETANNSCITHVFNSIFYLNTAKTGGYRSDIHSESLDMDLSTQDVRRNILQEYVGINNQVGVDPLFVNNTNDFRLQVTSPAVNAGNNAVFNGISPTAVGASTDLANEPRLFGTAIDFGAYELQEAITEVVPNCATITAPVNNATGVQLLPTILWDIVPNAAGYRLTIGTNSTATDVLDNYDVGNVTNFTLTTVLQPGTVYYVRLIPYNIVGTATGCTQIQFMTLAPPDPPQFSDPIMACGHVTVADLAHVGTDLYWYSGVTGGNRLSETTVLSSGTYYASRFSGTLESERTAVQIIVTITPVPQVSDQSFIPGSTFTDLNITGQNLKWYTESTGGSPFDSNTVISNGTYYVSQTIDGCESNRVIVNIQITELEYNIVFDDATFVYNGQNQSILVSGQLPLDAQITYSDNSRRNAGSQMAHVTISAPNFQTITLEAQLTIVPAQLVVRAIDVTKKMDREPFYGGNGVTFEGFVSGDSEEDLTGELIFSGDSQGAVDAGEYSIHVSGLSNDNYDIVCLPGKLTIQSKIIFPNVITPSLADGKNDTFAFRYIYNMAHASLIVFNSDGMEVYSSLDYQDDFAGRGLNKGTYFYVIHYTVPDNPGRNIEKRGFLTIL